jgi:predicted dehydrogenase
LDGCHSLVDYCGYGALLCRLVLGQPTGVIAVTLPPRKPDLTAEDNAVVVLSYPRALGLLEASWTQIGGEPAFAMIVYGDRGTLLVHQPRMTQEGERVGGGRVQLVTPGGNRTLEPPPLAADERDGPTYFLSRIRAGLEVTGPCAAGIGRDVQEVIAAALLASATGRRVRIPLAGEARV